MGISGGVWVEVVGVTKLFFTTDIGKYPYDNYH